MPLQNCKHEKEEMDVRDLLLQLCKSFAST